MIFAFLANTPCLVVNSKSYKVKGVYNWIKWCNKIKLIDNFADFKEILEEGFEEKELLDREDLIKEYDVLINLIKDCL